FAPGDILELPRAEAARYIDGRLAEPAEETEEKTLRPAEENDYGLGDGHATERAYALTPRGGAALFAPDENGRLSGLRALLKPKPPASVPAAMKNPREIAAAAERNGKLRREGMEYGREWSKADFSRLHKLKSCNAIAAKPGEVIAVAAQ